MPEKNHINYLNNQYAKSEATRYDLQKKLRRHEQVEITDKKTGEKKKINVAKEFFKPWNNFTLQAKESLENTVVSFKQNLRVINKTVNYYQKWIPDSNGDLKKEIVKQEGNNWAIRKPMHKETVSGSVSLRKIKPGVSLLNAIDNPEMIIDKSLRKKIKQLIEEKNDKKKIQTFFKNLENKWNDKDVTKVDMYYLDNDNVATRTKLDESFTSKFISESVTDTGIQKILLKHLAKYNENVSGKIAEHPDLAFSSDGIDDLNKNIITLNNGKFHHPILKVRTYEARGNKFKVGHTGNKKDKFVEAAKGTNLFFAIYKDENEKRNYETIPLNIVIENQKQGALQNIKPEFCSVPTKNEKGDSLLFHLSPNDLVYVPTNEECENPNSVDFKKLSKEQINRIYKTVSFTNTQAFFVKNEVANTIVNKVEYSALNKMERGINGEMIKDICWKIKMDRLGNILTVLK